MQIDDFDVKSFPVVDTIGLSQAKSSLKVCIVTEEIIGPVRNGGIASTYYHLSKGLAAQGHEVHVLFLKGPVVQDETPQHWVDHFAEFGVTLHYLELPDYPAWGVAVEWQERFKAAYDWLRDNDTFDVIHTSEWRGGMTYALMAKRLGLAFRETLFLVKTSSPHIWNRHYQMQPIERRELVLAAYAEQKCVELADAVIGGSAHLITFMGEIGYKVPDHNVFVQPNIVDFSKVIVTDARPPRAPGDIVKTKELIFFGRLEGRKGVELMCNALDILIERGTPPEKVSFMGKWGAPLATQNGMEVEAYITSKAQSWPFPVTFITDKNQPAALSHMCSRDMIAVMPSLIENSTMAVYETLENNIPFIATATGGTPELIDPRDHATSLVAPKSTSLADSLERALKNGQPIAHSSFSNDKNLQSWYGFHGHVGEMIAKHGRASAIGDITAKMDNPGTAVNSIAFAVLTRRGDDLNPLTDALIASPPDKVVLGFNDTSMRKAAQTAQAKLKKAGLTVQLADCIGHAAGDTLNMLAAACDTDAMVLAHGAGATPRDGFFAAARTGLTYRPDALFTTFFEMADGTLGMPIGGDIASHFLSSRAYGPELIALRRDRFDALGPFEPYDVRRGIVHSYVTHAVETGPDDLLVYPEVLIDWPDALAEARRFDQDKVYGYLKAKPLIDKSSIAQRKITLATLSQSSGGGSLAAHLLRDGGREKTETVWLVPVEWNREDTTQAAKRAMVVALDETENQLLLYARGQGERQLIVNNVAQAITPVETLGDAADEDFITLHHFDIPPTWEAGSSFPVGWGLFENGVKQKNQFLRINKIASDTFTLAARNPILSRTALTELLSQQRRVAALEAALEADVGSSDILLELLRGENVSLPGFDDTLDPDTGADLSDLLALAQATGRFNLERKSMAKRSRVLIEKLAGQPAQTNGDVRTFLTPPNDEAPWTEKGWLKGWAWDRSDPDQFLHIAVMRDGAPIFMVRASFEMPGLGRRTPGLERHGFRIPIQPDFLDPELGTLQVVVWETRQEVRGGTLGFVDAEPLGLSQIRQP